ncbi:helix-turn-helix domain-containing protein [Rodentibacter trehalosifermentans]|uniref:DNA-binding protein n=1 Tax=Rodentibacter trehalosifermentans TaxID=1908263 RepID=A0A1V3J6D3_9PAST|nr:helix-turn-helix domain-containing protein [Rodentibacter trehalosifermentans]OOF50703.1 DNA-binding protein [Rodentibacter trehalosifermentans]OOF52744.1 DNA-binding protein [Rodentibacter trehalosifermentans]
MEQTLTIKEVAKELNIGETTIRKNLLNWGFFRMAGSKIWRVYPSDLEKNRREENNMRRLCVKVGDSEKRKCRSEKINSAYGRSISPRQAASEFDAVVKRLKKN